MKLMAIALALLTCFTVGCYDSSGSGGNSLPVEYTEKTYAQDGTNAYEGVSPKSGLNSTGSYLEVDGVPFLMLGGQLRTDFFMQLEGKRIDELDKYFRLARDMNVTVVQIPICWSDIEQREGVYTTAYVEKYIEYCEKYELKLELLWFGAYMCGVSVAGDDDHAGYVPHYILDEAIASGKYEYIPTKNGIVQYNGWLGRTYMIMPNGRNVLAREKIAVQKLMDGIYAYDKTHGGKHTVIGIQVENEPDMLLKPQDTHYAVGFNMSTDEVCDQLVIHLDEIGKVIKNSDYKCYTRVNLTDRAYLDYLTGTLVETDGIDYVGLDPYNNNLKKIENQLDDLAVNGNFPHIAENGGEFTNNDQLELLAFTKGYGYEVFEIVTTYDPQLVDWELRGVYHTDFSKKSHTQRLIDANKIFRNGFLDIVLAGSSGKMLGFNLLSSGGMEETTQTLIADGVSVTHTTTERGIAYATVRNNVVTVASTKADTFKISEQVVYCEKGYYSLDGVWHKEEVVKVKSNTLKVEATAVYRMLLAE